MNTGFSKNRLGEKKLRLALSKGRILEETMPLLLKAGFRFQEDPVKSRKLIFALEGTDLEVIIIRATDVPTFVAHGAADLGIAGRDVIEEHGAEGVYELLDLAIAQCKLMVAQPINAPLVEGRPLTVATKFVEIARRYFTQMGRQVELIKLYGSMELAPLVGLADCIIDVVDTGKTLAANGLEPTELIMNVSSRLIVNKASYKLKFSAVRDVLDRFEAACSRS